MKKRITLNWGILWTLFMFLVLSLMLFFQMGTWYVGKKSFLLPNGALLLLGVIILSFALCLYRRLPKLTISSVLSEKYIVHLSIGLFFIQAYVFFNMYFLTDWDAESVSTTAACIASNAPTDWATWYYDRYPNNIAITWLLSVLYKVAFQIGSVHEYTYCAILFQCALSCWTGYMLFQIIRDITEIEYAYWGWAVYAVYIALNPWLSIPYTDAMLLCVPLGILRLYQKTQNGKYAFFKWFVIGLFTYIGFKMKPQCAIVLIAAAMCEGVGAFCGHLKQKILAYLKKLAYAAGGILLGMAIFSLCIVPSLGITVHQDSAFGIRHYLMMGLNKETNGVYSEYDVQFSASFATANDRNAANLHTIQSRIEEMGVTGLIKLICKKTLANFGDGTYSWGFEGVFYRELLEDRNQFVSPLLKNIFYTYGNYYGLFSTFQQLVWITMLFTSMGIIFYKCKNSREYAVVQVAVLSLIGSVLFQTIFEARARYFFIYAPFFLLIGLLGWIGITHSTRDLVKLITKA